MISVVVAVRNENTYISRCIESLFHQEYTDTYEVIVVDGMSTDGTYDSLKAVQTSYPFTLLQNKKLNAAAGRNIGIRQAKHDIIAFVDGDAIPSAEWLTQIERTLKKHDATVAGVGGPDLLPEDSTNKEQAIGMVMTSPLARGGRFNPSTQHTNIDEERFVEHIPTCNLALRKSVIEQVGLFDEEFVKGQDLELNYRIIKAGYRLFYSPTIKVVHYRKNHVREFARQIFKWAKAKVAIIKKHGMDGLLSHVYLWPIYLVALVCGGLLLFSLLGVLQLFGWLFLCVCLSYFALMMVESARLSKLHKNKRLFLYAFLLIPLVHGEYFFGVWSALLKRKIW